MPEHDTNFDVKAWADNFSSQFKTFVDGFKEDMRQRDEQIKTIVQQQGRITENVSRLTGQVEHLSEGQRGVFTRMNRPWQWGVVLSAFLMMATMVGAFATVLNLTIAPIKDNIKQNHEYQRRFRDSTDESILLLGNLIAATKDQVQHIHTEQARLEERSQWLQKMEDRDYTEMLDFKRTFYMHTLENGTAHTGGHE